MLVNVCRLHLNLLRSQVASNCSVYTHACSVYPSRPQYHSTQVQSHLNEYGRGGIQRAVFNEEAGSLRPAGLFFFMQADQSQEVGFSLLLVTIVTSFSFFTPLAHNSRFSSFKQVWQVWSKRKRLARSTGAKHPKQTSFC